MTTVESGTSRSSEVVRLSSLVADTVGDASYSHKVEEIIKLSRKKGLMFHGVKRADAVSEIAVRGVAPLTPESGFVSFWSSGLSLFFGERNPGFAQMRDSSFFDYGHTDKSSMTIVVTSRQAVAEKTGVNILIGEDSQITVPCHIPRGAISIVTVQGNNTTASRTSGALLERTMLDALHRFATGGEIGRDYRVAIRQKQ